MPPQSDRSDPSALSLSKWFAEEVQPHERELRAWLCHRFPDTRDIDDVVQESYARLLRARQTSSVVCARAYLFATARNVVLSIFRRPKVFSSQPVTDHAALCVVEEGVDVAERVSTRQEVALLLEAIDALPRRCREIFVLRKLHLLPQKEIALRLGLSEQTVQVQIARGAKRCVEYLRQRGVTRRVDEARKAADA